MAHISFDEMMDRLTGVLVEHEERSYLGMSSIGNCPRRLYFDMRNGRAMPGPRLKRLFHEGYLHERDLLARLQQAGYVVDLYGLELVAPFDARFRGHIDGVLNGSLLEIKSVNDERFMMVQDLGALAEHRAQCQCYMRYGGFADALIIYKQRWQGTGAFGHQGPATDALLIGSGIVTALPLTLFAYGARRIRLSTVGLLQYVGPTLQFLCGVLVFREAFPHTRLIGFVIIWAALAIYMADSLWRRGARY